jgi:hypothetical protein
LNRILKFVLFNWVVSHIPKFGDAHPLVLEPVG